MNNIERQNRAASSHMIMLATTLLGFVIGLLNSWILLNSFIAGMNIGLVIKIFKQLKINKSEDDK